MMKHSLLILPVLTALLIAAYFMSLPDIREKPEVIRDVKKGKGKDILVCALITLVCGSVAFFKLGDRVAPQTFSDFTYTETVLLELEDTQSADSLMLYSGITTGSVNLEFSNDGVQFWELTYDQNYAELIKWHKIDIPAELGGELRYIRLSLINGNPRIGEIAVISGDSRLQLKTAPGFEALTDEQETVPADTNYMNSSYFDEIYHARTAEEHIEGMNPYEISHPPLGKLILSLGIRLFGLTPFGWRFSGTLCGVLMLPVMYLLLSEMFGSTLVSACGTLLFATDFMQYTQTRIATIDSYAVLFILLMYCFMYRYICRDNNRDLALSGLFFGLGAASKWTCFYAGAGLALIWACHWARRIIREKDCRRRTLAEFIKNCGFCLIFFVALPALIYYLSYYPYGIAKGLYAPGMFLSREYLDTVLQNQNFMLSYHKGVTATHPYSSVWYQWVLDIRPILYYLKYYPDGTRASFGAFVNPVLCWGGLVAVLMLLFVSVKHRDRTAAFILTGYLAQLVPWMFVTRILFEYHYYACTVFLTLAMGWTFSQMKNMKYGKLMIAGLTALSVCLFFLFYPVLRGVRINGETATKLLQWLPTWPF